MKRLHEKKNSTHKEQKQKHYTLIFIDKQTKILIIRCLIKLNCFKQTLKGFTMSNKFF